MSEVVGVQFQEGGKVSYFLVADLKPQVDSLYVVETEHGSMIGRVTRLNCPKPSGEEARHLRRIVRLANAADLEHWQRNRKLESDAFWLCQRHIQEKKMPMKLVDVNYNLEGRKAVFYFTSENRVDFRELVKELAQALKVKIEMRQIGVRDEARRLGGMGCCGRPLCCCTFLKDFVSVSIRMAKDQNVSLNPSKVSGICGRLMCCLSYEYEGGKAKKKKGGQPKGSQPAAASDAAGGQPAGARPVEPAGNAAQPEPRKPAPNQRPQGPRPHGRGFFDKRRDKPQQHPFRRLGAPGKEEPKNK